MMNRITYKQFRLNYHLKARKTQETIKKISQMITQTVSEDLQLQMQSKLEFQLMFKLITKEKLIELVTCLRIKELLQPRQQMEKQTYLIIINILKLQLMMKSSLILDCQDILKKVMVLHGILLKKDCYYPAQMTAEFVFGTFKLQIQTS